MTNQQRNAIEEADKLLKQAGELRAKAWEMLCPLADEATIGNAMEVAVECMSDDLAKWLTDDDGFKACALIDWWEQETTDALLRMHAQDLFRWCKPCWMGTREWHKRLNDDEDTLANWIKICKRHEEEEKAWRGQMCSTRPQ